MLPREGELIAPRSVLPGIPRDLEIICLKCLESEPDRRYARASELGDDLERFLEGRAIAARPVGTLGLVACWCLRNRPLAAAIAVAVLLLAALAIGGTVSAIVQADLRHKAEFAARLARENELLAEKQKDLAQHQFQTMMAELSELSKASEGSPATQKSRLDGVWIKFLLAYVARADVAREPPLQILNSQFNLGRLLGIYGPQEESRAWYRRAVELGARLEVTCQANPTDLLVVAQNSVNAHLGLGAGLAVDKKLDEAIELWMAGREVARRHHPRFADDYQLWHARYALLGNLGFALKKKGRLDESGEVYRERATLDTHLPIMPAK